MNPKAKDLLIVVMALFIIALLVLIYKINRFTIDKALNRNPTEVYIMGMTEAIDRQNQFFMQMSDTTRWLERHLENCITLLESERGLKPIPMKSFGMPQISADRNEPETLQAFSEASGPFVIPYEKPKKMTEKSSEENNLAVLSCKINLSALAVVSAKYSVEMKIDNFQERLQRLDPKGTAADPNRP
jgi:hypothetical protein